MQGRHVPIFQILSNVFHKDGTILISKPNKEKEKMKLLTNLINKNRYKRCIIPRIGEDVDKAEVLTH